jgi:hypothetical protein
MKTATKSNYPSEIYCLACDENKPLQAFNLNSDGWLRSILCNKHRLEQIKSVRNKNYSLVAKLASRERTCECGGVIRYDTHLFRENNYQKIEKCFKCKNKKEPILIVRKTFYEWAQQTPKPQDKHKGLASYNQKYSAINQIENINHNPSFFSWLCAGSNKRFG